MNKAKELAEKISNLVSEFEEHTPVLSGRLESTDSHKSFISWELDIDDKVKIAVDVGHDVVFLDEQALTEMITALEFFNTLEPKQRKLLMSILDREE